MSSYPRVGQAPGIDTMCTPHLCHFLARFLEAKLVSQLLGFPSLFRLHSGKRRQLGIEPLLAHFEGGKTPVPPPLSCRLCLDVFDHKASDRIQGHEPAAEPQFPLPSRLGGWRQLLGVAQAIGMRLTTGCRASAASSAHLAAHLDGLFDPSDGVSLDIEIGMGGRDHTVAFFLTTGVNAYGDRLHLSRRWVHIEPDAEDALLPERSRLATLDPASSSGRGGGHQ